MTTVSDLGITPNKLRAYGHDGDTTAMTVEQLRAVCTAYRELTRGQEKWKRWPKGVQRELRARGIVQSQSTGMPICSPLSHKMSLKLIHAEQAEVIVLAKRVEELSDSLTPLSLSKPKPKAKAKRKAKS